MQPKQSDFKAFTVSLIFSFLLLLGAGYLLFKEAEGDALKTAPVLHQGRFRPFEAFQLSAQEEFAGLDANAMKGLLLLETMEWDRFKDLKVISPDLPSQQERKLSALEILSLYENNPAFARETLAYLIHDFIHKQKAPLEEGKTISLSSLAPGLSVKFSNGKLRVHKKATDPPFSVFTKGEFINEPSSMSNWGVKESRKLHRLYQILSEKRGISKDSKAWLTGSGMLMVPKRAKGHGGAWLPLGALMAGEPTAYKEASEENIRKALLTLTSSYGTLEFAKAEQALGEALNKGYAEFLQNKESYYPSFLQLKAELFYLKYDLLGLAAVFYFFAALFLSISFKWRVFTFLGLFAFNLGFLTNIALVLLRVFILERPPVSNMIESLLFVPLVASVIALSLFPLLSLKLPLLSASILSLLILSITRYAFPGSNLENAPAVLNSRFWLLVHVLMVVSSYAFFLVGSVLAHFHLVAFGNPLKKNLSTKLSKLILIILYAGTFLLISGTILGGIWAQQSWGRFWDWDPKESWAFISSCLYLILIHLYRFGMIKEWGLSAGAIFGALLIGFTWYGVNYLLGTGLHSYGFGTGGSEWFIVFSIGELAFIAYAGFRKNKSSIRV